MSDRDNREWLAALLGHLNQYPHLAPSTTQVSIGDYVQIYPVSGGSDLAILADWAETLTDPGPVEVTHVNKDDRRTHLRLTGRMVDGNEISVVDITEPAETDLLAEHIPLEVGATGTVEVLYRLVGRPTLGDSRPGAADARPTVADLIEMLQEIRRMTAAVQQMQRQAGAYAGRLYSAGGDR